MKHWLTAMSCALGVSVLAVPVVPAIEIAPVGEGATSVVISGYTFPQDPGEAGKRMEAFAAMVGFVHFHRSGSSLRNDIYHRPIRVPELELALSSPVGQGDLLVAMDLLNGEMAVLSVGGDRAAADPPFTVEGFEAGSSTVTLRGLEPGETCYFISVRPGHWPSYRSLTEGDWADGDAEENGVFELSSALLRSGNPLYVLAGERLLAFSVDDAVPVPVVLESSGTRARQVVPVASHIVGASGVPFVSDLTLTNPVGFRLTGWVRFVREGGTLDGAPSIPFDLEGGESIAWDDVLQTAFGITDNVKGTLVVGGVPGWFVQVSSRNYAVDGEGRRFGISIPGLQTIAPLDLEQTWILPGLVEHGAFRSNLVLAGLAPMPSQVTIRIIAGGTVRAEADREVPAYGLLQINRVAHALGAGDVAAGYVELTVHAGGVAAGLSVVDGSADDAAWIEARPMFP